MVMADLKDEFKYYNDHKKEFLQKYVGKYIVLKNHQLLGVYEDRLKAINATKKDHAVGTFLVQHVVEQDEQVRFHSRFKISNG